MKGPHYINAGVKRYRLEVIEDVELFEGTGLLLRKGSRVAIEVEEVEECSGTPRKRCTFWTEGERDPVLVPVEAFDRVLSLHEVVVWRDDSVVYQLDPILIPCKDGTSTHRPAKFMDW
jgi:hypothetical protein